MADTLAPGVDKLGPGAFAEVKHLLPATARIFDVLFHIEDFSGNLRQTTGKDTIPTPQQANGPNCEREV